MFIYLYNPKIEKNNNDLETFIFYKLIILFYFNIIKEKIILK